MVSDELAIQIARIHRLAAGARDRLERIAREVGELKRVIDAIEGRTDDQAAANGTRAVARAQAEVSSG